MKNNNLCVCACLFVFVFLLTDKNSSNEKMQEASPGQEEEVKVPDTSKQRPQDDGTAGAPESSSERPQPPTKALVSLPTVCVVSAAAPMLISHTSHFLTASLTHLLAACADINFSLPNTHSVRTQQTRAHRRSQHTHTHSQADNICMERGAETRGVFFSHSLTYQCLSGAVIWAWCMSPPGCLKVP